MPRSPSGVYSEPVSTVAPAVAITTIDPTAFNGLMADIGTEITNSLDRAGRGAMTAALPMGGFKISNLGTPSVANDAATKAYADSVVGTFVKTITVKQFNISGTYTPQTGMLYAVLEGWGGGGGGGGTANTAALNDAAGAGGGGGGYSRKTVTAAQIGASKPITVPAAAAGGAAGNNAGASAAAVSVGVLCIANGGSGGAGNNGSGINVAPAGTGATNGTGDDTFGGNDGGHGNAGQSSTIFVFGGDGGAGSWGGKVSGPASSNGFPGLYYGSGGTGGESSNGSGAKSGGAGAPGYVRITEYNSI